MACFLSWDDPQVNWDVFGELRIPGEELEVKGQLAWLHTLVGFGRSKLVSKLNKVIADTFMTARNLNTLEKLVLVEYLFELISRQKSLKALIISP